MPDRLPLSVRGRRSANRWMHVVAQGVLGAVAFEMGLPILWLYEQRIAFPYSSAFLAFATWSVTLVLFYVVVEPIRVRRRQWRRMLWYPPVWVAVAIACSLAEVSESLPLSLRPQSTGPDWRHIYPMLPIAIAFVVAICLRHLP